MTHVEYFKHQAKNLHKDYKTRIPYIDHVDGSSFYKYAPKYFDIESILLDHRCDENNFSLMKAQHIIARMVGFYKWTELLKASDMELELAKLLFDNQDKIYIKDWLMYIAGVEHDNKIAFDPDSRLAIFKHVFLNGEDFANPFPDYRLK